MNLGGEEGEMGEEGEGQIDKPLPPPSRMCAACC